MPDLYWGNGSKARILRFGAAVTAYGAPIGVPSFAALLAPPDIQDLFAYVDSLRTPNEPTFTHWWEANPTQ